jgi:hypothetical protein
MLTVVVDMVVAVTVDAYVGDAGIIAFCVDVTVVAGVDADRGIDVDVSYDDGFFVSVDAIVVDRSADASHVFATIVAYVTIDAVVSCTKVVAC